MATPCCSHGVERHAYNGCADCFCAVRWTEHPRRSMDLSAPAIETRIATRWWHKHHGTGEVRAARERRAATAMKRTARRAERRAKRETKRLKRDIARLGVIHVLARLVHKAGLQMTLYGVPVTAAELKEKALDHAVDRLAEQVAHRIIVAAPADDGMAHAIATAALLHPEETN